MLEDKTGCLIVSYKGFSDVVKLEESLNQCLQMWSLNLKNLVFICERKQGIDQCLQSMLSQHKLENEFFTVNPKDNWYLESGKFIKAGIAIKLAVRYTSRKNTPRLIILCKSLKADKLEGMVDYAIAKMFSVYIMQEDQTFSLEEYKNIQSISDPLHRSIQLLAWQFKGDSLLEETPK